MKEKNQAKVLIVDDLPTNVELLQAYLEEEGYITLTASNGKQACEMVQSEPPDIILLDVMMPIMDGYEACRIIKGEKSSSNIPIVMITSLNEASSRIEGIEAGADDFLSKPFNIYELLARVKSLLRIKQYNDLIIEQNRIFQEELQIAKKVQQAILPKKDQTFEGLTYHYQYIPCQSIGGDYLDICQLNDGKIAIFLADVMGHGVAASLITMVLKTLFDNYVRKFDNPSDFLYAINNELQSIFGDLLIYATGSYIILDIEEKKLQYANAAHPPALLFNADKNDIEELQCQGTILGIFSGSKYQTQERLLDPNDQILLYTDGLTDILNSKGELFGDDIFYDTVKQNKAKSPEQVIANVLKTIYDFAQDISFEDDVNIITFRIES